MDNGIRIIKRWDEVLGELASMERPMVALSGGLDSAVLAVMAHEAKGAGMLAVTAVSPSLSSRDRTSVEELVASTGMPHAFVEAGEFSDERYVANDKDRCYFCKFHLFQKMNERARTERYAPILYGAQYDDLADYRPGMNAASEGGARAPFIEAGWGKAEIRSEAARRGLAFSDRPASPCLSSRLAYGVRVTADRLRRIESAEEHLRGLGMNIFRVRDKGDRASIELGPVESAMQIDRAAIVAHLVSLGFTDVVFDERGYRQGSLNEKNP